MENMRWDLEHPEIPKRTGKIRNLEKFDASFFAVHSKLAQAMDPMSRVLLELAYETLVDAGVNPNTMKGSNTGVFIGACYSESEKLWLYERSHVSGFGVTGNSKAMYANRISYYLNIHGPSYCIDTACSSSMYAFDHAFRAIQDGRCDSALVGGCNLCLHPVVSLQFFRLGVLGIDGKCKSFDNSGNGYCRSEAISMIYLQRATDAKRIYATVVHSKTNCDGYKEQGITYPSGVMQGQLLEQFYRECGVPPDQLNYLEAHGTGTKVGDPEELNAVDHVLCSHRKRPLLIGSVKSNVGHSEPSSALSSIVKILLGMETGLIPPNLHYVSPREGVPALLEGRMKVVTEPTPWEGGYAGASSFGFGGANAHVLLLSNPKMKPSQDAAVYDGLPRLVVASGRSEEAVETILSEFENKPLDSEYVALLHSVHSEPIQGHIYRGFSVIHARPDTPVKRIRDLQYFPGARRPIWFVFAGMGSQWAGMGRDLMQLPVFARAIEKCDMVLKPRGLDIKHIITHDDTKIFDNILNSFVGIAAVQVGLVDVLREAGIVPDGIVGHSVGELGCAYADGCFTAEQMVLAAYSRGLASLQTPLIHGSMAAVGLSHEVATPLCPPDVEVACHNGKDSCTISGPAGSVSIFVTQLKEKGVFAREVACSNIAYHSRYIVQAGTKLLQYLREVIPEPRKRSSKWISSSAIDNDEASSFSSAEYHTNNLLKPVLFAEALLHVPKDAITIEIAPHGLLQAILRRTLPTQCTNVSLTQRGAQNALDVLFAALGKLYVAGIHPQLMKLHPPVQFPVSRGTPMLSPLVRWQHKDDWRIPLYKNELDCIDSAERSVLIDVNDFEKDFYLGHVIDGRNLFPATGYLFLVWETFALCGAKNIWDVSVVFENIKFVRATNLPKTGSIELIVMVTRGTGTFEVVESGATVVTGRIYMPEDITQHTIKINHFQEPTSSLPLTTDDVYKELRLRGYNYSGVFKVITHVHPTGLNARIKWLDNWVGFMDALLQVQILQLESRSLYVPTSIQKLVIDTRKHKHFVEKLDESREISAWVDHDQGVLESGGIQIYQVEASVISRRKVFAEPVLESQHLVPLLMAVPSTNEAAVRVMTHLVLENAQQLKLKVTEWVKPDEINFSRLLGPYLSAIFDDLPLIQCPVSLFGGSATLGEVITEKAGIMQVGNQGAETNASLVLVGDAKALTAETIATVAPEGFLLARLLATEEQNIHGLTFVSKINIQGDNDEALYLFRKVKSWTSHQVIMVGEPNEFKWVTELQEVLKQKPDRVYLVAQHTPSSGLLGLVNCLTKEGLHETVRCVFILDEDAPEFSPSHPSYSEQLSLDLIVNGLDLNISEELGNAPNVLLSSGHWATYRHQLLEQGKQKLVTHAYLNNTTRGDLSSLRWLQGPITNLTEPIQNGRHLYHVYYASLNFRDVMTATGKLAVEVISNDRLIQDCVQGIEFSGRDSSGRRVMGMAPYGALANIVLGDPLVVYDVPSTWTLEEAATVPTAYSTVYYALVLRGHMCAGESVLVHAASGGVGQAALNVALHMGCTVYVTVGTAEKRAFIRKNFPTIPEQNIGNSRDTSFEQMIKTRTKGRGVDLVLNSLSGDKLQASLRCLGKHGRFLEIGKVDMVADSQIGMHVFLKEISIHGILLDFLFLCTEEQKKRMKQTVEDGIRDGAVKPLVRQVFGHQQGETAFRYMASGKHIGKVMLQIREEESDGTSKGLPIKVKSIPRKVPALPRFFCDPHKSYVIVGGLGGFGLELADWLVLRGAKKLILNSRSGVKTGYQAWRLRAWERYGAKVLVSRSDVTCEQGCWSLLDTANRQLGVVDAIFNLAVVLRDELFFNQTVENFEVSFMPKAQAGIHLDEVSRRLCPDLKHFVMFSSVSCGRGNAGQTNYGFSNSVMERLCEQRREQGLPALAIQWGAIGDVGLIAEKMSSMEPLVISGTLQQGITSCLATLDVFLTQQQEDITVVASMVVAEKTARGTKSGNAIDAVLNILGIKELKTISLHSTMAELGMDSMMAVEIKQTLEREFEMFLTPQDLRSLTFARLKEHMMNSNETAHQNKTVEENGMFGGLQRLLQLVGYSSSLTPDALVKLPSQNSVGNRVFMVPGIEGFAWVMEPLARQINYPVCCLQLPLDCYDIHTLADSMTKVVESEQPIGPYLLLGYSYGSALVLEMAQRLLNRNQIVQVVLLDGSPLALQNVTRIQLAFDTTTEGQREVKFLQKLLTIAGETTQLSADFVDLSDWETRLTRASKHFPEEVNREHHVKCVNAVYKRLIHFMNYSWLGPKLECTITLVRCAARLTGAPEDYHLNQICSEKVCVHSIDDTTHMGIVTNSNTAHVINQQFQRVL